MADVKKYWYIQLNVNFFDDERIDWLCEQKNGYAYVVLYLKLCLKTANNNGILTRQIGDMIIPYNVDKIAETTHMDVDVVRVALELYKRIGLVYESDENCNFMRLPEVPSMVGYTTQYAIDKAKQRERKRLKALPKAQDNEQDNVQDDVSQELRDKSLELRDNSTDKEKDNGRKRPTPPERHKHGEYGWVKLSDAEYQRLLSEYGEQEVARAIRHVDESAQNTGNRNGWKDWNLTVRRCIRDGWGKQKGGNYGNGTGNDQRRGGSSGPENRPTKRLKNAFDFMAEDQTGAGASDCGDFQQGTREIDISELF